MESSLGTNRRAFTLVELLIVIGIIGVLISILLPAMNRARAAAAQAVCLSNLRQLAMATYTYAADNRGSTVPSALVGYSTLETIDGVTGQFQQSWNYGQVVNRYSFKMGFLGRYLPSDAILECPSMKAFDLPGADPLGNMPRTTYGIALMAATKFSRIQRASETAIFGDAVNLSSSDLTLYRPTQLYPPGSIATFDAFHGRHVNGSGNLAFYDGHAEGIPFRRRPRNSFAGSDEQYNAMLVAHLGPATPSEIDPTLFSSPATYQTYATQTLAYYFWPNKYTKGKP